MTPELVTALSPLVAALVGAVLGWVERKLNASDTLEDAGTPASLRRAWESDLRERLKRQADK